MPDLVRELELLAAEVEYPATPDLTLASRRALAASPRRQRPRRRVLVLALALFFVMAGTVFAAVPSVRHAVLDFFHLRGATVERVGTLPPAPPARPRPGGGMTLAQAQGQVGFKILVPARLGRPRAVRLSSGVPDGEVLLGYRRLLVSEFRGDTDPDYVGKIAGAATRVERLRIDGRRALWIAGAPHFFFYRSPNGTQRFETLRLAGNVLLLERGPLLVRLEGARSLSEAIAIVRSLR